MNRELQNYGFISQTTITKSIWDFHARESEFGIGGLNFDSRDEVTTPLSPLSPPDSIFPLSPGISLAYPSGPSASPVGYLHIAEMNKLMPSQRLD